MAERRTTVDGLADAFIGWADSGNWNNNNKNVTFPVNRGGLQWYGQSDYVKSPYPMPAFE